MSTSGPLAAGGAPGSLEHGNRPSEHHSRESAPRQSAEAAHNRFQWRLGAERVAALKDALRELMDVDARQSVVRM